MRSLNWRLAVLMLLATVASAVLTSIIQLGEARSQAPHDSGHAETVVVRDREEASRLVGFEVPEPGFLPASYRPEIVWVLHGLDGDPETVMQAWTARGQKDHYIFLWSSRDTVGLIEGEPATVRGGEGLRVEYGVGPGRETPLVGYFWREDGIGHTLAMGLPPGLSEQVALRVVESVGRP